MHPFVTLKQCIELFKVLATKAENQFDLKNMGLVQ